MNIHTLWVMRKSETVPELLEAWDEFSVDENPYGFKAACADSLARVGSGVESHRFIDLSVSLRDVERQFGPAVLDADVVSEEKRQSTDAYLQGDGYAGA